ncbi:hypothetical protein CSKR_108373 [Clonorchis sinensis]|uniref:Lsm14-like N-terminal domain-containing protein n=2 Tax=Clonorchis sinensis TaxID=79923 RepID=A0A8T1N127_CLOSI|nr:hypothetical protein CSKR_108373 [Clonorchis sinensis]
MSGAEIQPSRFSLGTKVSLITVAQYRYEGVVAEVNSVEGTLTLNDARFWGTENRISGSQTTTQHGDNKPPPVGSTFDSITFWMSSIVQMWSLDENKMDRNDLGDKAVVKAGLAVDTSRNRTRRPRHWWPSAGDQQRPGMRGSPSVVMDNMNGIPVPVGRYVNPPVQPMMSNPSRRLVSYPRRSRTAPMPPRQPNYVPVFPVMASPGGVYRPAYRTTMRGPPYRTLATPISNGTGVPRITVRKPGPPMRRMVPNGDDRRYNHIRGLNNSGGMLVYLPPEMAAAYQSHGTNLVLARAPMGRRRLVERRTASRAPGSIEPDIDCTTPYDFETANAELEAELAKITINADGASTVVGGQPQQAEANGGAQVGSNAASSTGDGLNAGIRSPSSTVSGGAVPTAAGNGASGDSSLGAVTSSMADTGVTNAQTSTEGTGLLAKGEYYVREKCFFDQISRSETGPRGPFGNSTGRATYNSVLYRCDQINGYSSGAGLGASSVAAARRERQLNMETFGSMAAQTTFAPRRRPPREFLVSASA